MTAKRTGTDIRAVLFDIDDTLFDRMGAQTIILEHIIEKHPNLFAPIEREAIIAAFFESDRLVELDFVAGAPSDTLRTNRSRLFLELLGLPTGHADAITAQYVNVYPTVNAPVPGAPDLLSTLAERYPIGIVSNGLPDVQYRKLESIGILERCTCIVLSEELGIRKPDPRIFLHTASLLQVEANRCLYVGNSYHTDVIGAKAAGMIACWLNRKGTPQQEENIIPDFIIREPGELTAILG